MEMSSAIYDPLHNIIEEQLTLGIDMVAIANKNSKYHCQQQQEADPDYNAEVVGTESYCEEIQAPIGLANAGNTFIVQICLLDKLIGRN